MARKKSTRWDLAFGGTNVSPPGMSEWSIQWPKWLERTFVNLHYLQQDPIELRCELFHGRDPRNAWSLVDTLLISIEKICQGCSEERSSA